MKVEVDVLGHMSLINLMVSVDIKHNKRRTVTVRVQELCESRGGRPGPSLISLMVSVDVKHNKIK